MESFERYFERLAAALARGNARGVALAGAPAESSDALPGE